MKRALSLIMAIIMCLSCAVLLASCGHECEWAADWSKDATHHWKACTDPECTEVGEKAEHTFGAATEIAFGVTQSTCSVCGEVKTDEKVTEVAADKWAAAFEPGENFKLTGNMSVNNGAQINNAVYSRDGKKLDAAMSVTADGTTRSEKGYIVDGPIYPYMFMEYNGVVEKSPYPYGTFAELVEDMLSEFILDEFKVASSFTYNADTNLYSGAPIDMDGDTINNITLGFIDGKLVKAHYEFVSDDATAKYDIAIEYGNVSLTAPTINGAKLTAEQWYTALDLTTGMHTLYNGFEYEDDRESIKIGNYGDILVYSVDADKMYYEKNADGYFLYVGDSDTGYTRLPIEAEMFNQLKGFFNLNGMFAYDKFTYDEDLQAYYCASLEYEGETLTDVTVHFDNGKLLGIIYKGIGPSDEISICTMSVEEETEAPPLPSID